MNFTRIPSLLARGPGRFLVVFVLAAGFPHAAFAQVTENGGDMKDRIAIQEELLYAYAYTYDSKDCVSWANQF